MSDLISRAEAVDVLSLGKEILSRVLDDIDVVSTDREKYSWGLELIESIIKDIEDLPSAQPEQRWIPCSERVPEEDEQVLVYLYDSPYIAWIDSNGEWNTEEFTLDKEKEREDEPIAWMPLPEPYKERREE